jgi:hypothetical protein
MSFFISAIIGGTLTFLVTEASNLDFNTLTDEITLSLTVFKPSVLKTFCCTKFLYLGFSE